MTGSVVASSLTARARTSLKPARPLRKILIPKHGFRNRIHRRRTHGGGPDSRARRPVARRPRWVYAGALYRDAGATLGDLREAVTTLEDTARIARRVLGGAHPLTAVIEDYLQDARTILCARETSRETPPPEGSA